MVGICPECDERWNPRYLCDSKFDKALKMPTEHQEAMKQYQR